MKKISILFAALLLVGCSDRSKDEIAEQMNYYFSENETACAFIFYDVEGAEPLKIEDGIVNHHFDGKNLLLTSSPSDFGWKSKKTAGFSSTDYYIGDQLLPVEEEAEIRQFSGGIEVDGADRSYSVHHFNDREECFAKDSSENTEIFFGLVSEIYKKNID